MNGKPIYDITPHTLIDYEGKIASIIWFAGCALRCVYCHNPHIVGAKGAISEDEALLFLSHRLGWYDGVVLSGGECCMYDGLDGFCKKIQNIGLAIKVDTSGIRPKMALRLAANRLVDTIALDFKAPKEMFWSITGAYAFSHFEETLKGLLRLNFDFTVRTTVYADYMNETTLCEMCDTLYDMGYRGVYTIQKAITSTPTIANLAPANAVFAPQKIESKIPLRFIGF